MVWECTVPNNYISTRKGLPIVTPQNFTIEALYALQNMCVKSSKIEISTGKKTLHSLSRAHNTRSAAHWRLHFRRGFICFFFFFFFRVKFKSIGAKPHVRPYSLVDYLRPLAPFMPDPLEITPCTGGGTPVANIPPRSPARKRRFFICALCNSEGSNKLSSPGTMEYNGNIMKAFTLIRNTEPPPGPTFVAVP